MVHISVKIRHHVFGAGTSDQRRPSSAPAGPLFFFVSGRNHKLRHRKLRYGGITEIMTDGQVQTGPDAPGDSASGASPELVKTNVASPGPR